MFLIEKYLLGNKSQPFNPISEAKDVLTSDESSHVVPERSEDDVTLVGKSLNLKDLQDNTPPPVIDDPEPDKGLEIVHQHVPVHDLGKKKKKNNNF